MMNLLEAWIENLSEVLEQREAGFIKDGYEWRIVDFEGFDILFSPRMEHRYRKRWSKKKQRRTRSQKKKKTRIENEAKK